MKKWGKYSVALFVVFLLASSFVWAIPGIKKPSAETQQSTSTPEQAIIVSSESDQNVKYVTYEEISEILSNKGWVLGGEKLDKVQSGVDSLQATLEEQNDEIDRQEAEIKELKALVKKETGTKYFMDLGAAFGFRSEKVQYGIVGDMGLRFGKGLMVKTGVQYMVGDMGTWKMPSWSMDALTVSTTVGWEW